MPSEVERFVAPHELVAKSSLWNGCQGNTAQQIDKPEQNDFPLYEIHDEDSTPLGEEMPMELGSSDTVKGDEEDGDVTGSPEDTCNVNGTTAQHPNVIEENTPLHIGGATLTPAGDANKVAQASDGDASDYDALSEVDEQPHGDSSGSLPSDVDQALADDFIANCEDNDQLLDQSRRLNLATKGLRRMHADHQHLNAYQLSDEDATFIDDEEDDVHDDDTQESVKNRKANQEDLPWFNAMPGKRSMKQGKGKAFEMPPGQKKKARKAKMQAKRLDRVEQKQQKQAQQQQHKVEAQDLANFSLMLERLRTFVERNLDTDCLPPIDPAAVTPVDQICSCFGVELFCTDVSQKKKQVKLKAPIIRSCEKTGFPNDDGYKQIAEILEGNVHQRPEPVEAAEFQSIRKGKDATSADKKLRKQGKNKSAGKQAAKRVAKKGERGGGVSGPNFVSGGEFKADDDVVTDETGEAISKATVEPANDDRAQEALGIDTQSKPTIGATAGARAAVQGVQAETYRAFEKFTTGFGSKMLERMGYVEGKGLGPRGEGITEPIVAYQRQKRVGLGADG